MMPTLSMPSGVLSRELQTIRASDPSLNPEMAFGWNQINNGGPAYNNYLLVWDGQAYRSHMLDPNLTSREQQQLAEWSDARLANAVEAPHYRRPRRYY